MTLDTSDILVQTVAKFFATKGIEDAILGFTLANDYILRLEERAAEMLVVGNNTTELNDAIARYGFGRIQFGFRQGFIAIATKCGKY